MGGKVSKEPRPRFVVPTQRVKNLFKRRGEKCPPYIPMNSMDTVKNKNDSETRLQILENQLQQTMMDLEYSRSQIGYLQAIQQDHEKLLNETSSSKSVLDSILAENKQLVSENKQLVSENKQLVSENKQLASKNKLLVSENKQLVSDIESLMNYIAYLKSKINELIEGVSTLLPREYTYTCMIHNSKFNLFEYRGNFYYVKY
jgi:DNA repair exonuclease SbcCD ATPase subunit